MRTEIDVALADPDAGEVELRQMGEAIRETIDRCEHLLESLLMLARSEAATGQQHEVDLAALAADCITDLRARAEELQLEVRDELRPALVLGDPPLLERMIANLVDNAIRHNERGGFVAISTRREGPRALVAVANSGPVISPEDVARLTEPFRRLDRSRSGFGLGLSIVRSVVEVHGGELLVTGPPEGGLEIGVSLPAASPRGTRPLMKETPRALTKS
jgi:signal transduction histidine kinase